MDEIKPIRELVPDIGIFKITEWGEKGQDIDIGAFKLSTWEGKKALPELEKVV